MEDLKETVKNLGTSKVAFLGALMVALFAFFVYIIVRANDVEMGVLFSGVEPAEGAKIIEKLNSMRVEYKVEGTQIMAPIPQISQLRMQLAEDGLPNGSGLGYEIFDKDDTLGTTSAMLNINKVRALEGELSKSIKSIQGVHSARVHLVMPKRELFSTKTAEPAASIVLRMESSTRLNVNQVQAVRHLVAAAVPNLSVDRISIVDDRGTLLARGNGGELLSHSNDEQLEIQKSYEMSLSRTIETLLERSLGPGKVRAEVNVDMDFDRITTTSIEYDPEGQVARTVSTSEEGEQGVENGSGGAVSIENALPGGGDAAGGSSNSTQSNKTEENTQFEISNKKTTHIKESGSVRRLSVAVLVDGFYEKDKDGKETYKARSQDDIEKLTKLVKKAIGFNEERGDQVELINMAFSQPEDIVDNKTMVQKVVDKINVGKAVELFLLSIIGLIVAFAIIKPVAFRITGLSVPVVEKSDKEAAMVDPEDVPDGMSDEEAAEFYERQRMVREQEAYDAETGSLIKLESVEGRLKQSSLKKITEILDKHPDEAVNILRSWIYSDK